MEAWARFLKLFVETTGPIGAIIAAVIVGLGLALIAYAKSAELFAGAREQGQKGDLIDHFTAEVARLAEQEEELDGKIDALSKQVDVLKDQRRELQTKIELLRSALRRAIDLLRAVKEGRLPPEAIDAADIVETTL